MWNVFEKMAQSNARSNSLDILTVIIHAVRMAVEFGRVKTKDRPLSVIADLKVSIIEVKAETNCLAHALAVAIPRAKKTIRITKRIVRDGKYVPLSKIY
jgi:hypothetical protein